MPVTAALRSLILPVSALDVSNPSAANPWHRSTSGHEDPSPVLRKLWETALGSDAPERLDRRLRWNRFQDIDVTEMDIPAAAGPWYWLEPLHELRTALRQQDGSAELDSGDTAQLAFRHLWHPVVARELRTLREAERPGRRLDLTAEAWRDLGRSLLERLCKLTDPVLWDCFNRERGPGTLLMAQLRISSSATGPWPRDHYNRFIGQQQRDGLEKLLDEFPVLGRLLGTVVALWRDSSRELLDRLEQDRQPLAEHFGITEDAPLTAILQGVGDVHRGGRSVAILRFGSEQGQAQARLVYKPKDMRLDAAYQKLLENLNDQTDLPPLRTVQVLVRSGYGYMEFIPHRLSRDADELKGFYRHAGRLTAVLYMLGCTDCHHENLIACGDQLVLIDTETLLEPDIPDHVAAADRTAGVIGTPSVLQRTMATSVLRSGLVPRWKFVGARRQAMDISALGISPPASATEPRQGWIALNSDGMMAGVVQAPSAVATSLPVGIGEPNPLGAHLQDVLDGFREQSEALLLHRQTWLTSGGLLQSFAGLTRRIVLRNTHVYGALQQQQLQPLALRSAQSQGLVLEQLARAFLLAERCPRHWPVFAAEVRQMEQLDVPFFVHPVDGLDLPLEDGIDSIQGFCERSGLQSARDRLEGFDQADIDLQCRLIAGAVMARQTTRHPAGTSEPDEPEVGALPASPDPPDASQRLALARQLLDDLEQRAIPHPDGSLEWLGIDMGIDGETFAFGPAGLSLWGGSAGVALLRAAIARSSHLAVPHDEVMEGILRPLLELADRDDPGVLARWWRDRPLGLSGGGGVLLTLLLLDRLEAEPPPGWQSHRQLALRLLQGLKGSRLQADRQLDIIGGGAGLMGPLLQLGEPAGLELARELGDLLLQRQENSGGWSSPRTLLRSNHPPLTGFSHGASGIATALAALHGFSGEVRFLEGCRRALDYERSCFDPTRGNWPDYRRDPGGADVMVAWCHGAPGIALSRLCLRWTPLWSPELGGELHAALQTTAQQPPLLDHLCCGAMGLVAILRVAARYGAGDGCREAAIDLEAKVLNRSGVASGALRFRSFGPANCTFTLPGLLSGQSGIALALLGTGLGDAVLAEVLTGGLLTVMSAPGGIPGAEAA